jgi:hypothetical protein
MSHNISVKNSKGENVHHSVHKDIYVYIKQLEMKIIFPTDSKLTDVYPHLAEAENYSYKKGS